MTGQVRRRSHCDGGIDERGENVFRLRYRIDGKRHAKTLHGTLTEARKELRRLIRSGDTGEHVAPNKITVTAWIDQWIKAGAPGRRKKKVSQRTLERYKQLLNTHIKPKLGVRPLQQLQATEIDKLYSDMATAAAISNRTQHHVHVVLGACLGTATRKGLLVVNPMVRVEQIHAPDNFDAEDDEADDIGEGLTDAGLANLVAGFKSSAVYPIVVLAASTGARRNELLALRWTDLDTEKKTLRIERAWEPTKKFGLRLKPPKTARGRRTIDLDDATVSLLLKVQETHQRLSAGIPDGADVDLSLIRLPSDTLIFPQPGTGRRGFLVHHTPHPTQCLAGTRPKGWQGGVRLYKVSRSAGHPFDGIARRRHPCALGRTTYWRRPHHPSAQLRQTEKDQGGGR
jgi:integrase